MDTDAAIKASEFGARVFPHISGRVLSQVLPSQSLDKNAVMTQARNFVKEYNARGIPTRVSYQPRKADVQ
jgi:hypothetical protein